MRLGCFRACSKSFNRNPLSKLALPKKLNADTPHPLNYHRAHRVHRGGFL